MPTKSIKVTEYNKALQGSFKLNGNMYSLPNLIKDEIIDVELSKDLKEVRNYKVTSKSNHRVTPPCNIYNKCGGCHLLHIDYNEQLKIKQELIEKLFFEQFNKIYKVNPVIGMEKPMHYRNKNQVVFQNAKGGKCRLACGFYEEGSHKVVDFTSCYIQDEESDKIVQTIKDLMLKMHYNAYDEDRHTGLIRHVLIKRSSKTKEVMVVIVTGQDVFPGSQNFVKALVAKHKEIKTVIQNVNNKKTTSVLGDKEKILFGKGYILDILMGKKFKISSKSFYQINSIQCEKLYSKAFELAKFNKNDVILDAYSGVGTIGLLAADSVKKVISVELVKDAINDAIFNAKLNKINNVHFFCDDASRFISNLASRKEKVDCVIMDPPRKGSDNKFMGACVKLAPRKIVYISCDPRTQVVDLEYFINHDYKITAIQPVDMFPHTNHVENIVCLEKN